MAFQVTHQLLSVFFIIYIQVPAAGTNASHLINLNKKLIAPNEVKYYLLVKHNILSYIAEIVSKEIEGKNMTLMSQTRFHVQCLFDVFFFQRVHLFRPIMLPNEYSYRLNFNAIAYSTCLVYKIITQCTRNDQIFRIILHVYSFQSYLTWRRQLLVVIYHKDGVYKLWLASSRALPTLRPSDKGTILLLIPEIAIAGFS